jgi:hypothetical protein
MRHSLWKLLATIAIIQHLALAGPVSAKDHKDHSNDYKMGTFDSSVFLADGSLTNTLKSFDGETIGGGVSKNYVHFYRIRVEGGTWRVITKNQADDSRMRNELGMTPQHFKPEKPNPLDGLKNGDKVLFRLHEWHSLVGGKGWYMSIPYADNPNKEVTFEADFYPDVAASKPEKPTDNVKAMCESGKLSAALKAQYCGAEQLPAIPAAEAPAQQQSSDKQTVLNNQCIVDMLKAGLSDDAIVTRIRASKTRFDISGPAMQKLAHDAPGIPMIVITEMARSWAQLE